MKAKSPRIEKDPLKAAKSAGLRYVSDDEPGFTRKKSGKKFSYFDLKGKRIENKKTIERINALVIPPAYKKVWICPDADGHIQATGIDERGRKQYRYHPRWRSVRDDNKFAGMIQFAHALPKIRERTESDLRKSGYPREKVLAAIVQLLEKTAIRVGNQEYARENKSYGLTTMLNRHAKVEGGEVQFHFRGKSGKWHDIDLKDRKLAKIVSKMQDLPGQSLFQYEDEAGDLHHVTSGDVNAYLKEISGENFTAKDFRTWSGTVAASLALQELENFENESGAKRNIVAAVKSVSEKLGNTPSVCRKSYIHPAIFETYLDGSMLDSMKQRVEAEISDNVANLKPEEAAVLGLLRGRLSHQKSQQKSGKSQR